VESGRLLGFIISKDGIHLDLLNVEAIVNLPPPPSLHQLQSLQGKANFLRRFIPNYAGLAIWFTRLLKQGTPFAWDEVAQKYFDDFKVVLINAPLLHPPDHYRDYFLYLVVAPGTIVMVLVQDDDEVSEHVIYYLSQNLLNTETCYAHVKKLALAVVQVVQRFRHYILLRTTTVISKCNPMTYILTRQLLGSKYSKWIVILQLFNLVFTTAKSKKSLVFTELICSLSSKALHVGVDEQLLDETIFLISTLDQWYGDIIMYLQTSTFRSALTKDDRRRIQRHSQPYRIIGNMLYHVGVDFVLRRCLTIEEAERALNDCHSMAYGGHMSGYATAQKILCTVYFWPSIFKDCILDVHKCHECQIYQRKMRAPPAHLHHIIIVGSFAKWSIDYMTYNPRSAKGHGYIIVVVNYFTK